MDYYTISAKASGIIGDHGGLQYLQALAKSSEKILDVGCGEGTRLHTLTGGRPGGSGIDPSVRAVTRAKKQYPDLTFTRGMGEKLPYPGNAFDLVYSAFAIEHCGQPENFIREMIRVTRPGGHLVILAPNYGAPNRRSPNSVESPYNKFAEGLIKDIFPYPGLDWRRVVPQKAYLDIDVDTTFEPYLKSLILFLTRLGMSVEKYSSLWSLEKQGGGFRTRITALLGRFGVWPVSYWGPQIFVSAIK